MPNKLAIQTHNLRIRYILIQLRYGVDIFSRACNLYMFCFNEAHSREIVRIRDYVKKSNAEGSFPFLKQGYRESAMIYTFLLARILKKDYRYFWEDAIFIIYFTYFTGFNHDGYSNTVKDLSEAVLDKQQEEALKKTIKDLKEVFRANREEIDGLQYINERVMRLVVSCDDGLAFEPFKKAFKKVSKYNFDSSSRIENDKVRRFLIEKQKSFVRRYNYYPEKSKFLKEVEKVEFFIKIADRSIKNGF